MNIRIMVWDENGLSHGEIPLPAKTIAVTIVDGDREVSYDPESLQVILERQGQQVTDFDDDPIAIEYFERGVGAHSVRDGQSAEVVSS